MSFMSNGTYYLFYFRRDLIVVFVVKVSEAASAVLEHIQIPVNNNDDDDDDDSKRSALNCRKTSKMTNFVLCVGVFMGVTKKLSINNNKNNTYNNRSHKTQ